MATFSAPISAPRSSGLPLRRHYPWKRAVRVYGRVCSWRPEPSFVGYDAQAISEICTLQRSADDFLCVTCINMAVGKGGRGPGQFSAAKRISRLYQSGPADFLVTLRAEMG